jgi:hypothetical protein
MCSDNYQPCCGRYDDTLHSEWNIHSHLKTHNKCLDQMRICKEEGVIEGKGDEEMGSGKREGTRRGKRRREGSIDRKKARRGSEEAVADAGFKEGGFRCMCMGEKIWKPHPFLPSHTHSEARCLLNQQGLDCSYDCSSTITGQGLVRK